MNEMDTIDLIQEGSEEDVADVLEALMLRMERMSPRELDVVSSIVRGRKSVGDNAVDVMTDVIMQIC